MREGVEVERSSDRRQRKLARLRALEAESDEALDAALPPPGTLVDGLVLECILGRGGFGTVYRARTGEQPLAVKFIYLPRAAESAHRELGAMVRLEEVGGAGLRGHGLWPPERPVFQFIVMDFVPGWELYTWARHHNPNALEVVDVLLDVARELEASHSVGVVHRDVKGDNVLVREADQRALLVDFGVASYPGAPSATSAEVPGCREYLSPEVVRFNRGELAHHEPSGLDDLWSMGVMTYKLLTATYPFQGKDAEETERAIMHEAPEPPHERNPRAPRALSELCLRMMEKEPGARYPDARALRAALAEVKRGADEAWKVALCEAWGPDAATTLREGALSTAERVARLDRLLEYERRHPRRGEPWPERKERTPRPPPVETEAVPLLAPRRAKAIHTRAVVAASLVMLLGTLAWLSMSPMETWRAGPPPESVSVTSRVGGQEVAPPVERPEGGGSAEPSGAATPASVASATHSKDRQRVKTKRNAPSPGKDRQPRAPAKGSTTSTVRVATVCTVLSACTGAQVRPNPEPVDCPAASVKSMEELGVYSRTGSYKASVLGTFLPDQEESLITVRGGGPITLTTGTTTGKLPAGSTLSGQLILGNGRVYGRFTEARTPRGDTFPVCFQLVDLGKAGARVWVAGPGPDLARISSTQEVTPVTRFE